MHDHDFPYSIAEDEDKRTKHDCFVVSPVLFPLVKMLSRNIGIKTGPFAGVITSLSCFGRVADGVTDLFFVIYACIVSFRCRMIYGEFLNTKCCREYVS